MTTLPVHTTVTPEALGDALALLRERQPLVQCLTNVVVTNVTANVLLAVGASPAMVDNPQEAGVFAGIAHGVLVNLGTPYSETAEAMRAVVAAAAAASSPWVLDPVAAGPLPWRTELAHALLATGVPAVVRGNASEVLALAGAGQGGRGVDATDDAQTSVGPAKRLAAELGTVVAVSGPVDHLTDGTNVVRLANGHPWLTQVTGAGCSLGALMAAFAAVTDEPLLAAAAATATLTVAADVAAETASGPGSFAVGLLDALAGVSPGELAQRVRLL